MFRFKANGAVTEMLAARLSAIKLRPVVESLETSTPRRQAMRQAVYRQAVLLLECGERLPVIIRDISETGIRVEFFRNTPISDVVIVDEASLALRIFGRVVWQRDGASGLILSNRLQSSQVPRRGRSTTDVN